MSERQTLSRVHWLGVTGSSSLYKRCFKMYGSNREVKEIDEDLVNDYSTSWELCSTLSRMRMFKVGTLFDLFWNEGVQGQKWKISGLVLISSTYAFMWSLDLVVKTTVAKECA